MEKSYPREIQVVTDNNIEIAGNAKILLVQLKSQYPKEWDYIVCNERKIIEEQILSKFPADGNAIITLSRARIRAAFNQINQNPTTHNDPSDLDEEDFPFTKTG